MADRTATVLSNIANKASRASIRPEVRLGTSGARQFLRPMAWWRSVRSLTLLSMVTERKPHDAPVGQLDFHRRCLERDRHERRLARLGSLASSLFSHHRLGDAILKPIDPAVEGRSRNALPEAEDVDLQAAGSVTFKPLLPVQIVVQIARWPSHRVSPKSVVLQHSSLHDLASMDLPDAY